MQPYATLARRGQVTRLRRLGRSTLSHYGLEEKARLTLLRHEHNTTFRVAADSGRFVLRINRIGQHAPAAICSEMTWLAALHGDADLASRVPEPVAARDGSLVVSASDTGVPEPRSCVLLRWLDGRFVDDRLTPRHLRQVAALLGALQQHTHDWMPPRDFGRPRVDNLTGDAKRAEVFRSAQVACAAEHPSREDADRALQLVEHLWSAAEAAVFARALEIVRTATRELGAQTGTFGLIHADLHQENYLFHDGGARAIDFDDCGWGFYLYDLAVTFSELEHLTRRDELRAALVDEYARRRPLPERHETYIEALSMLRLMQLLIWVLESREHAAFRDEWQAWTGRLLRQLSAAVDERATWTDASPRRAVVHLDRSAEAGSVESFTQPVVVAHHDEIGAGLTCRPGGTQ